MTLTAGAKLGRYEIVSPLGAGGMGEVYRARDTRLGRDVAVKVLASHLSSHPTLKLRFEREAQVISQLSHPNVCTLYDVGSDGEVDFLVMELMQGETLGERLERGALSVDTALTLGIQIATGLAAAHRCGIVHRDLKPGNIMLTRSGVKLLDFGLARIATSPEIPPQELSASPTEPLEQGALTRGGTMIGTLQYMAPEQVEGKVADARSDLFALGSVLYEMLTGAPAFVGPGPASLMAAILTAQPVPVSAAAPTTPPALERLIRSCLAKDPNDRWQAAHDVRLELESIRAAGETAARPARGRWPLSAWVLTGALLVAVVVSAAAALVGRRGAQRPSSPIRFALPPPPGQTFVSRFDAVGLAFSPDGTSLAFIADAPHATREVSQAGRSAPRIWLRRLAELEPRPLPGTEGVSSLFWSPDGKSIGFSAESRLRRVEIAGGAPMPICDLPSNNPVTASWGADAIVFASSFHGVIYRVSPDGGPLAVLVKPDPQRGETRAVWPWFLPDGRTLLYVAGRKDGTGELMVTSLAGPARVIGPITSRIEFFDPGYLVFAQDGALFAHRFDAKSGRLIGSPLSLAPKVHYFYTSKWAGFAVSRSGAVAYAPKGNISRLTWFDRSGRKLSEVGASEMGNTINLSISPDGGRALFDRTRPETGTFDVWMLDLARGIETRVTSDPATTEFDPVWLPDGRHVVYSVVTEYLPRLFLRNLMDGTEEPLLPVGRFQEAMDVTPDGRTLLFSQTDESGTFGLWTLSLVGERRPAALATSKYEQELGRLSRDGRLLAYISDESGQPEAYVAPLRSPRDKVRLSPNGATGLAWGRDNREVYFTSRDRRLFSVTIGVSPSIRVGQAVPLFELPAPWSAFDVAPDGRFLASVQEVSDTTEPLTVALNWTQKASPAIEGSDGH